MIEVGMFATVRNSTYVDFGIQKGDLIYVAGEMMIPVGEQDPYLHRKIFVAAYTEDEHVDSERKPISMDGTSLKAVSKNKQKRLYDMMEEDFKKEE